MGKQINYYMEYESFVRLAEKAAKLGCVIIRCGGPDEVIGKAPAETVTMDCTRYYFYVPEVGEIAVKTVNSKSIIANNYSPYSPSGNTLIEAGYSLISPEKRKICRARLFCVTGYYDEKGSFIKRPECVTRVYDSLVREVKKISPYTELTDTIMSTRDETYLQKTEYRHKEYITEYCLNLRNEGYELGLSL